MQRQVNHVLNVPLHRSERREKRSTSSKMRISRGVALSQRSPKCTCPITISPRNPPSSRLSLGTLHEILSEYSSNDRSEDTCNRIRNADRHSGGIVLCRAACGRRAARVIVNMKKIIKITKNLRRRGRARGLARATFL